jgi:hypothetical protein
MDFQKEGESLTISYIQTAMCFNDNDGSYRVQDQFLAASIRKSSIDYI